MLPGGFVKTWWWNVEPVTYPEHEKLSKVVDKSQTCGELLDWLQGRGIMLGHFKRFDEYIDEQFVPYGRPINNILADFFEIDLDRIETEKRAMLEHIRKSA